MGLLISTSLFNFCIEDDYADCNIPSISNYEKINSKNDIENEIHFQTYSKNLGDTSRFSPVGVDEITDDFLKNSENRRKVNFKDIVSVILIPTISELKSANLFSLLWWSNDCITEFKSNYEKTVKLICKTKNINISEAIKILNE